MSYTLAYIFLVKNKTLAMRKIITVSAVLLFTINSFCQTTVNTVTIKNSLLQKSKNQKTTGWIMLGGGAVLLGAGLSIRTSVDNFDNPFDVLNEDNYHGFGARGALIAGGVAAMGGAVVFLIASVKNKNKAMHLTLTNQEILLPQQSGWAYVFQPSLKLSLSLGRRKAVTK